MSSTCGITAVAWKDSGRQILVGLENGTMATVDVLSEVCEVHEEGVQALVRLVKDMLKCSV